MRHNEKWYQRRLARYFTEKYEVYEYNTEFWSDPDINQWLFDIPVLDKRIELTCRDNGKIEKTEYPLEAIKRYE